MATSESVVEQGRRLMRAPSQPQVDQHVLDLLGAFTGMVTVEELGVVVSRRALTDAERAAYAPPDPRADLIAAVESATTVDEMRVALLAALEQKLV